MPFKWVEVQASSKHDLLETKVEQRAWWNLEQSEPLEQPSTMFVIRAVPTEALTSLRVETETNSVLVHTLLPEIPCGQEPSW